MIAWWLWTVALATKEAPDPNLARPDVEVIVLDPVAIGSEVEVEVPFTYLSGTSGYQVQLVNEEGTAFRFADGGDEVVLTTGSGEARLVFAPSEPGRYRATVELDGNQCAPVEVRGSAFAPCLVVTPRTLDWGETVPPDADLKLVRLQSCDDQTWTVDSALSDNPRFIFGAPTPLSVTPVGIQVTVQFQPLDGEPQLGAITLEPHGIALSLVANDCANGNPANWDSDGDGISDCGIPVGGWWEDGDGDGFAGVDGDCDDGAPGVFPGAVEVDGGVDDDCDGVVDEHLDADADGTPAATDCDDADPFAGVGEVEVPDGVDNDCDGTVDDGAAPATCGAGEAGGGGGGCGCDSGPARGAAAWWVAVLAAAVRSRRSRW